MIILKLIKYTNSPGCFEANWVERKLEGKEVLETPLRCVAYSGDQIDLFRADVATHGGEIDEAFLADIEAEWVPPVRDDEMHASVPRSITMRQARIYLHRQGKLAEVEAMLDSLEEPIRTEARIEWEYSNEIQLNNPLVQMLSTMLGVPLEQWLIEASKL